MLTRKLNRRSYVIIGLLVILAGWGFHFMTRTHQNSDISSENLSRSIDLIYDSFKITPTNGTSAKPIEKALTEVVVRFIPVGTQLHEASKDLTAAGFIVRTASRNETGTCSIYAEKKDFRRFITATVQMTIKMEAATCQDGDSINGITVGLFRSTL